MKKILHRSICGLILLLFFQLGASAQITIGTGTSTQLYPFNYYYGYGRDATIYTAAEMNTVSTGGTVTTISWYTGLASGWVSGPTVIYLKAVGSATAVTDDTWANTITGATTVYTGTPVWANGWNSIDITDFTITANQNLEVLIESNYGVSGTAPSTGNAYRYSTGATGSHAYWAKDTNAPTAVASSDGGINTNRPNVILGGLVIPAVPDCPTLNTPANGATGVALNTPLTWTAAATGGAPTSYKVYLGTVNPPTTLVSTVTAPTATYTPSGQAYSTLYYWYVVPGNNTGDAVGCNGAVNSYTTTAPPPPPSNNDCSGATMLTVAPGNVCVSSVSGTTLSATASAETAPSCSATGVNDDVWYSFVATATTNYVSITGATNTTAAAVYSGACGSLTQVASACSSSGLTTAAGLTPGNTYLVRVYSTSATATVTSNFNICVYSAPVNDNCAGAITVPVNTGITCTSVVSGSLVGATASAGPTSSCGTYDDDVWYSFTATQSAHIITLQNLAGSTSDLTFQVLASCGASSAIICSDPQSATVTGLTPGATYYLRVASYTSTGGQTSTFDVCITTPPNMAYVSSTSSQPVVTSVSTGSSDQQILRADVVVSGLNSPLTLTSLTFNTSGTTLPADITSAKVYYTGTSTTFGTTTPFGTAVLNPNGTFTVTGSQVLAGASTGNTTNYFFLAYDISCTAAISNVVDAEITSMTIAGTPQTPTVTAPAGTRAVSALYAPTRTDGNGTTAITGGAVNALMVYSNISGSAICPGSITNVTGTASGTFVAGDVVSAKCYYTTSSTFAIGSAVQFGSAIASPVTGASLVFTGSQTLASGSGNYFWIVYDISCTAAANTVNATINSLTVGATPYTISTGTISANTITVLYAPSRTDGNSTTAVITGSVNNRMVYANISGSASCPANVTAASFTVAGTAPASDIAAARCYYTTSTTFSTTTPFGTAIANPAAGTITFTGSQALAAGTGNYFWLVYDIACGATATNTVNGTAASVTVGATPYAISTGTISANAIAAATSYTTIADGEWNNTATWACGSIPPTNATAVTIATNITVSNTGNVGGSVTVNSGASLTVNAGGDLTLGVVGGDNKTLTNNGTLSITGGTLTQNGNVVLNSGSTFNQSAGNFVVDGNGASSVPSGTVLFLVSTNLGTVNGGTLTITDPPATGSARSLAYSVSSLSTSWAGHTIKFGDGVSTAASTNTNGFEFDTYVSTGKLLLGNMIADAGSGTNRWVNTSSSSSNGSYVGGNLTINPGSEVRNNGAILLVGGNVVNNGTLTTTVSLALLTLNGGTVVASAVPQSVSGSGVFRNSATTPTANLATFETWNTSATGVTLNVPVTLSSTFYLDGGLVRTTATNLLTVGVSGSTIGTISYTGGMVAGPIKKWYAAATGSSLLPVGDGTNYKPATINFTTAPTTAGTLTAVWSSAVPSFPNASPLTEGSLVVNKVSKQGSWFIDAGDGLAGGTYTATVTGNGSTDVLDYTKTVLVKRPSTGGDWALVGTHVTTTGSNTAPVLSRTGVTAFSEFAIGGESNVALPIYLEYFTGRKQASVNVLDWKVSSSSASVLTLERSTDRVNFKAINMQTATTDRMLAPFTYTDAAPAAGINYYRLKITNADGESKYSNVVALINKEKGFELISIAPNPVQHSTVLSLSSVKSGKIELSVSDATGKVVMKQSVNVIAGNNPITLNFATLASGTYQITAINADGDSKSTRFVKF